MSDILGRLILRLLMVRAGFWPGGFDGSDYRNRAKIDRFNADWPWSTQDRKAQWQTTTRLSAFRSAI